VSFTCSLSLFLSFSLSLYSTLSTFRTHQKYLFFSDAISSVSEDVINLECVYADESDRANDNSVVYSTTILILCGPFLFLFVASMFWSLIHCWEVLTFEKKKRKRARARASQQTEDIPATVELKALEPPTWQTTRQQITVSVIVVMVLIHPTLTRRSVQLLTCDRLGDDDPNMYLRRDLEIVCWQGIHMVWAMTIGMPFLILYAAGIPLASLYVMYQRKHKLRHCQWFAVQMAGRDPNHVSGVW
jgi:hypothetical protein